MKLYCTSVKTGPLVDEDGYVRNHPRMLYLGVDRKEALRIVPSGLTPSNEPPSVRLPQLYSALPIHLERTVVRYYRNGDTWCSIVEFNIEEN